MQVQVEVALQLIIQRLDALAEGQAELKKDIVGLKEGQAELKQDIVGLKEGQAELKQDIVGLKEGQAGLKREQSAMKEDIKYMQNAILDLLGYAKKLEEGQNKFVEKIDLLAEMFGRHDLDIRHLKRVVNINF